MITTGRMQGLSAIFLSTLALLIVARLAVRELPAAAQGLLLWSGLQAMGAFLGFTWALPRSNKAFFSVLLGDAALRVLTLGAATWALHAAGLPYAAPLIALAVGYLVLPLVQIPFLPRAAS